MENKATFFILASSLDGGITWSDNFETTFETGQSAQAEARRRNEYHRTHYHSSIRDRRFRVRKVVDTDNDNFIARELAKNHNYIDWSKLPDWRKPPHYEFAHIHPQDKTKVRLFTTVERAIEEIYTVMRLPRFLTNWCDFAIEEVEEFLIDVGYYSGKAEFKILRDADEIENAYVNGPTSCMNDPDEYPLPSPHPARAYASPDIGLAVLVREGDCVARGVVCPDRKIFGRLYGHTKLLAQHLKNEGYRETHAWSAWRGVRLNLMRSDWDEDYIICPYLDMTDTVNVSRDGQYLRIAGPHGRWGARNCEAILEDNYW